MTEESNEVIVACCGLVCSQCGAYTKGRCGGCHCDKPMNLHCKVKPCVQERGYTTCAGCVDFKNLKDCKKLNNFISKIFAVVSRSDRLGNLSRIREVGQENFQQENAS